MYDPNSEAKIATSEFQTIERIKINALEHFSKYGYLGANVREITAAANVTKPTLYYYFKNKEELYRGLASACVEKVKDVLRKTVEKKGPLMDRVVGALADCYHFIETDLACARFLAVNALGTSSPDVPQIGDDGFKEQWQRFTKILVKDAHTAGEVKADNIAGLELVLDGIFTLCILKRLFSQNIVDMNHVRQSVRCFVGG